MAFVNDLVQVPSRRSSVLVERPLLNISVIKRVKTYCSSLITFSVALIGLTATEYFRATIFDMAPKKVIVHANSETHELEVESFSDLKEKVIGLIGIEDIDLKINNKIMDEKTEIESKVHIYVAMKINVDVSTLMMFLTANLTAAVFCTC